MAIYGKGMRVLCPLRNDECVYSPSRGNRIEYHDCAFGESEENRHGVEIDCHVRGFLVGVEVWSEDR